MRDARYRQMWRALGVYLFFTLVQLLVSACAGGLAASRLSGRGLTSAQLDAAALAQVEAWGPVLVLLADGLTIAGLLVWNALRGREPLLDYTALRRPLGRRGAALCALAGLSANIWFGLVVNLFPFPESWVAEYAVNSANLGGVDALSMLAVVLVAPLCEELVFRGRVYGHLAAILPAGAAAVLQAILFGGMHNGTLWMVYAVILGCVLGYLRKLTGSLRAPLLMHICFNGGSYLFALLAAWAEDGRVIFAALLLSAAFFVLAMLGINRLYYDRSEQP